MAKERMFHNLFVQNNCSRLLGKNQDRDSSTCTTGSVPANQRPWITNPWVIGQPSRPLNVSVFFAAHTQHSWSGSCMPGLRRSRGCFNQLYFLSWSSWLIFFFPSSTHYLLVNRTHGFYYFSLGCKWLVRPVFGIGFTFNLTEAHLFIIFFQHRRFGRISDRLPRPNVGWLCCWSLLFLSAGAYSLWVLWFTYLVFLIYSGWFWNKNIYIFKQQLQSGLPTGYNMGLPTSHFGTRNRTFDQLITQIYFNCIIFQFLLQLQFGVSVDCWTFNPFVGSHINSISWLSLAHYCPPLWNGHFTSHLFVFIQSFTPSQRFKNLLQKKNEQKW